MTPTRPATTDRPGTTARPGRRSGLAVATALTLALVLVSLGVGGYDITLDGLLHDPAAREMFLISRVPRTLALVLAATAMGLSGVVLQMIVQNRFVEPTTIGSAQWAALGILLVTWLWPGADPLSRMAIASTFAFVGTLVFLGVLRRVSLRSSVVVPIVGMMLGSVVSAGTLFLASELQLQQALASWRSGGFSSVVRGQYEPLWAVAGIVVVVYVVADRFTIAGLGREVSTNLGLNHTRVVFLGSALVALATGVTAVVVGFLPFLGLIVPNVVSMLRGDDLRRNLPWVALASTALIVVCDLVGRTVVFPLEIPASVVLGAVGATTFVVLVLNRRRWLRA
ncbi:ABC transporter permease [Kineococcus sp. LSe6-4]|uniref:ABC transporter permease n=1 Tax=Kineococcus halophytocola TaxID=3234027 RepID=A0ABV4H4G4_9ACTN